MTARKLARPGGDSLSRAAAPPAALVEVDGLDVRFGQGRREVHAVRGLSLHVRPGEMVALVGESGSGKSTVARALVGLAGPTARVSSRRLRIGGSDVAGASEREWRRVRGAMVGFVLQDALVSLDPLRTVGAEVGEPLRTHDVVPRAEVPVRVRELLASVGVPDPEVRVRQRPHELSGGLRQRALIASALAAEPSLLIADEPTTALDVTVGAQVMEVLGALKEAGKGVLLISHDLAVVARSADRILVMRHGEVVEEGAATEVLSRPTHAYTRQLLAAVPSAARRGQRLSSVPPVVPAGARPAPRASGPVAEVRDVTVTFPLPGGGRRRAVDGVSFVVPRGRTVGIVGESGSGKSTVARVLMGLQQPDAGEVVFDGEPWSTVSENVRRARRGRIQIISQDPLSSFDPRFTVERIVGQALRLHTPHPDRSTRREEATRLLGLVGLGAELLDRRPRALSGGQRQRVAIARALATGPELLVCDEAVSSLDVSSQAQVLDLLGDLRHALDLSLVFISHDLGVIHHMSEVVVVMQDGRVVEAGDVDDVFHHPSHPYTRRLLDAVPRL